MANEAPNLGYVTLLAGSKVSEDYGSITAIAGTGEVAEGTVLAQLPSVPCKMARIQAPTSNTSSIYIGKSNVTTEGTVTNTTTGWQLEPGDDTGWMFVPNLNLFYTLSEGTGDMLNYIALS